MDTSWLPHWTTAVALAGGLVGIRYFLPEPRPEVTPSFQERFWTGLFLVLSGVLVMLPLMILSMILLVVGWGRSPWGWNVAAVAGPLWFIGRSRWKRPNSANAPTGTANPLETTAPTPVLEENTDRRSNPCRGNSSPRP